MRKPNPNFLVRLIGSQDPQPELQVLKESNFLENIFDGKPIYRNRPNVGCRGPSDEHDIDIVVGEIAPSTVAWRHLPRHGNGIYATARILPDYAPRFQSLIGMTFGLDITAETTRSAPYIDVISVDVVVDPRGTGRVIAPLRFLKRRRPN